MECALGILPSISAESPIWLNFRKIEPSPLTVFMNTEGTNIPSRQCGDEWTVLPQPRLACVIEICTIINRAMVVQTLRFAAPYTKRNRSKKQTVSCTPGGTSDTDFRNGAVAAPRITTHMTGIALVGYLGTSTITLYSVNRSLLYKLHREGFMLTHCHT